MSQSTQSPPGPDASPDEIEADIARTRARLADSVDALADKVNVKARAQEKVDEVKTTAQAKVADAKATAQAKVEDVRTTAQARAAVGRDKILEGAARRQPTGSSPAAAGADRARGCAGAAHRPARRPAGAHAVLAPSRWSRSSWRPCRPSRPGGG